MYYTKILKIITGGARNLLPLAYERPAADIRPKRSKTGKNREFLQKTVLLAFFTQLRLEHTCRISVFLPYSAQKFPTKITGNFLDYIRELSTNIREFNKLTAKPIFILFFRVYVILFEKRSTNRPTLNPHTQ